jgi:hypothetical protein
MFYWMFDQPLTLLALLDAVHIVVCGVAVLRCADGRVWQFSVRCVVLSRALS